MQDEEFALARSNRPYLGLPIVVLIVVSISIPASIKIHDWSWVIPTIIISAAAVGIYVYYGTRYRIWWRGDAVVLRTADGMWLTMRAADMTKIEQETSDFATLMSLRRPLRRITLYSGEGKELKYLDISLKHFAPSDIRKLLRTIHQRRPDLSIPRQWI